MSGTTHKHLALIALALMLSSCAALESGRTGQDTSAASDQAARAAAVPPQTRTTRLGNGVEQIAEMDIAAAEERQRLIDEINTDGQRRSASHRDTPPTPVTMPDNDVVELNYEQADLRDILADMADALDISLVIDPTIADQVSIRTAQNRPLSFDDIWPLMRLLTREAGVVMERVGNVYYVRRSELQLPVEITTPDQLASTTAAAIMQITPLTYISVSSALELVTPLIEPDGRVTRISNSNTLAITANESQLARINELLSLIDDDPFRNQGIQLYPLGFASAEDLATELHDVLTMIEGANPAYQVMPLARINSLLVTAPASRGFNEISRWVRLLDADRQEQAEQLFQYRVKNLNATELAATLTEVFRTDERDSEERALNAEQRALREQEQMRDAARQALGLTQAEAAQISGQPRDGTLVTQVAVSADLRVSIVADDATNSLLIRANPRDYRQLLATISQLDAVPLQVMINAAIAQITLTDETAFGVDWSRVVESAGGSTRVATSFLPATRGVSGGNGGNGDSGGSSAVGGLLFNRSFLDGAARIDATLQAIAVNNEVRLLARPSVTVINNMEGLIRIGAEVPVQLGETIGTGGFATTNIQYRPTGIELYITPRINDDGVVNLTIRQELSSLSGTSGINENPIFQNQEIETTVVVRDGENVVLGGLIQDNNDRYNTGVPFLNQVPGLGRLFSYQRNDNERQELFIVLRPEIVNLNEYDSTRYREIINRFERAAEMLDDSNF